jgi:selenocysteine-specific elongation factor
MSGRFELDLGKPRLAVALAASTPPEGVVVTGFLRGGTLRRGLEVVIQPSGVRAQICGLRAGGTDAAMVPPGCWVAARLVGRPFAPGAAVAPVARGAVVTLPGLSAPSDAVDVGIEPSGWLKTASSFTVPPARDRARVRVLAGPINWFATLFLHGAPGPGAGGKMLAQLRFDTPAFLFADDQLIILDASSRAVLATARVLDPHGDRKRWQRKAQRELLEARAAASEDPACAITWVRSALDRDGLVGRKGFLDATGFSAGEIVAALEQLAREGQAVLTPEFAAVPALWERLLERAGNAVDRAHQAHPEWLAIPLTELRAELEDELPRADALDAILAAMTERGFVREGDGLRRASHRPRLPAPLEVAGAWLRRVLKETPLTPPSRQDLTPNADAARALRFLIETGEVMEVGPDQVLEAAAYREAVARILRHLQAHGSATTGELRHQAGCPRRIIIPLCEKLDAEGVTRREGDRRTLGPAARRSTGL